MENKIEKLLTKESIFIIGRVSGVIGRAVKVRVNKNKNHSHIVYEGNVVKNVSVGSYIKIMKGFITIIGKVDGEFTQEEKYYNKEYKKEETKINRELQVTLFGHFEGKNFKQGIKEMPLVDNECYVLSREEFEELHRFSGNDKPIHIGRLTEESGQEIHVSINKLFASHIGIFGNTGCGKSNTLARIYSELFKSATTEKFKSNSQFIVIDFNGEYIKPNVITPNKTVYGLSTEDTRRDNDATYFKKYPVTKEDLSRTEILSVLLEATEKTQKPFLDRVLSNEDLDSTSETDFHEKVFRKIEEITKSILNKKDTDIGEAVIYELFRNIRGAVQPGSSRDLLTFRNILETSLFFHSRSNDYYWISGADRKFNNEGTGIYNTFIAPSIRPIRFKTGVIDRLKLKIILGYYHEVVQGHAVKEFVGPLIGRMFRKFRMLERLFTDTPTGTLPHNLTIVSLKDVNVEMKKIIPLIICKQLYDKQRDKDPDKTSLHIIIDEAHNILSSNSQRESETWKDYRLETFEEIIKEGRKFSTFLTIASQRPYDISSTIVSQLHNYFIHKLINENDINAISRAIAYLDKLSFETIPILPTGSCFMAGLASDIPVKVDIRILPEDEQPKSQTIKLQKAWGL